MRTGATQSSPVANPDVVITIGADIFSSQDGGRLLRVYAYEKLYGGQYAIEIDNSDEVLNAKDYKGSSLSLYFGFIGETGSTLHTLTVDSQEFVSRQGKLLLVLSCIDMWGRLSFYSSGLGGSIWNYPEQSAASLADRTLSSGEAIPADIQTAIIAQYDVTIEDIVDKVLLDTIGMLAIPESSHDDSAYYAYKPLINADDARSVIAAAMENCSSYLRLYTNQFKVVNPSKGTLTYTYNAANLIFSNLDNQALVRPLPSERLVINYPA